MATSPSADLKAQNVERDTLTESPLRTSHSFTQRRFFRWGEWIAEQLTRLIAFSTIAVIGLIFLFIAREAIGVFSAHDTYPSPPSQATPEVYGAEPPEAASPEVYNPEAEPAQPTTERLSSPAAGNTPSQQPLPLLRNLLSTTWQPVSAQPKYGLLPLITGSLKVTVIALLLATPIGVLAAIFVAFFAPLWLREAIKPIVELLAGFPSVVIGFFCLMVVGSFVQETLGTTYRLNAFVAGIGLAIAIVPVIFTIAEDGLANLPRQLWEAGLALGARPWQVVARILVPAATPALFAAVLLGFGRSFGETMIVLMASGNAPLLSWSPVEPVRTMAATIGAEMGEVVWGSLHYSILFLIGLLLFAVTFTLNSIAELWVRQRLLKRFRGLTT